MEKKLTANRLCNIFISFAFASYRLLTLNARFAQGDTMSFACCLTAGADKNGRKKMQNTRVPIIFTFG